MTTATMAIRTRRRLRLGWALVFLSPWIFGFAVFTFGPMIASLVLSFTHYDMISSPEAAGLANYRELVQDPYVRKAIANTLFYTAFHVPLQIILALGLAALLRRLQKGARFFRTVIYLPAITPPVAMAAMFLLLLNGSHGAVNQALRGIGLPAPNWTTDPAWIKPGLILMGLWTVGTTAVLYLAALQDVPPEVYEAAQLDGAGAWSLFRHVTLPLISPTIYFTVIVNTIASLQYFTEAYTMFYSATSAASSDGDAALFYVIYLFRQAFTNLRMGYASALAWLLFLIIAIITFLQVRASKRLVHYEGEPR